MADITCGGGFGGFAHDMIVQQCDRTSEAIAVTCGMESYTYSELNRLSLNLAGALVESGVTPETRVAIMCPRSPSFVIAVLGALRSGGVYVPLSLSDPTDRLGALLQEVAPTVILTDSVTDTIKAAFPDQRFMEVTSSSKLGNRSAYSWPKLTGDSLAYIMYTSGSSGRPKGVMVPHRGLSNYLTWCRRNYPLRAGTRVPVFSSLNFDLTVTSLLLPLVDGLTVELIPEKENWADIISSPRTGVDYSFLKLTPAHLAVLSRFVGPAACRRVDGLVIGGEKLKATTVQRWRQMNPECMIFNEYGPTEATVGCSVYKIDPNRPVRDPIPIGRPLTSMRIYILDPNLDPVPAGLPGEIYIGGEGVARGYFNAPATTAARFLPDPFGNAGARMYRTGDTGRRLADGTIEYIGRRDRQVKIKGFRIELGEVETVLDRCEIVRSSAVIAASISASDDESVSSTNLMRPRASDVRQFSKTSDNFATSQLVAFVVLNPGVEADWIDRVSTHLGKELPAYMVPRRLKAIAEIPTTANGKVDYGALVQAAEDAVELDPFVPPVTDAQRALVELWEKVLETKSIGIRHNFFRLGGDSIRALQVQSGAAALGIHFDIGVLLNFPTIESLCKHIREESVIDRDGIGESPVSTEAPDIPPGRGKIAYPLSSTQSGILYHSEYAAGGATYHDVFVYRLRIGFDKTKMQMTLDALVDANPALRTSFDLSASPEPLQLVHSRLKVKIQLIDLREAPEEDEDIRLRRWIRKEKERAFDPSQAPLFRISIHRFKSSIALGISFHNAILDGWSIVNPGPRARNDISPVFLFRNKLDCQPIDQGEQ